MFVTDFVGDVGVDLTDEEEIRRRDRTNAKKLKVREVKVTQQSRNVSNDLAGGDKVCSDSCGIVDKHGKQRRRLSERVSIHSETTTSGTDGNVERAQDPPRHSQKRSTLKVRQKMDDVEHGEADRFLSSGQIIKSAWNNVDDDSDTSRSRRKKRRARNKNVNASTQTTTVDDDRRKFEDLPTAQSRRNRRVDKEVGKDDEVDSEKFADMIRLMAAPILASEVKTALLESRHPGGKTSTLEVADVRTGPTHHNHHHHHHHHHHLQHHHQPAEDRGPWQQTAKIMAHPPAVKISSYEMSRATGRVPAAMDSTRSADRCPHCSHRRRPEDAGETASSTEEQRATLDQLLTEMCRYCDRDCGTGQTASQLKTKLKRAILAKYYRK